MHLFALERRFSGQSALSFEDFCLPLHHYFIILPVFNIPLNMNDNSYKQPSYSINWLRFPLIFLIIMLHCYSVVRLEGSHETYFKCVYMMK